MTECIAKCVADSDCHNIRVEKVGYEQSCELYPKGCGQSTSYAFVYEFHSVQCASGNKGKILKY